MDKETQAKYDQRKAEIFRELGNMITFVMDYRNHWGTIADMRKSCMEYFDEAEWQLAELNGSDEVE